MFFYLCVYLLVLGFSILFYLFIYLFIYLFVPGCAPERGCCVNVKLFKFVCFLFVFSCMRLIKLVFRRRRRRRRRRKTSFQPMSKKSRYSSTDTGSCNTADRRSFPCWSRFRPWSVCNNYSCNSNSRREVDEDREQRRNTTLKKDAVETQLQ